MIAICCVIGSLICNIQFDMIGIIYNGRRETDFSAIVIKLDIRYNVSRQTQLIMELSAVDTVDLSP